MSRPSTTDDPSQSSLGGLIERVTFHSEESGFAVLRVKAAKHRDLVTVVGTLPSVSAGEWIEAEGDLLPQRTFISVSRQCRTHKQDGLLLWVEEQAVGGNGGGGTAAPRPSELYH